MEDKNLVFDIYNGDGSSFHGLSLRKSTYTSSIMAVDDRIEGDVYYVDNNLTFTYKEYVIYNGVNFYLRLDNPPTIVRKAMTDESGELKGMTKYSFTFYHPMVILYNIPFTDVAVSDDQRMYKSEDTTFSWIGTLTDLVAKINKNLPASWTCKLQSGYIENGVMSDVIQFQNQKITDVLKTAYDTYKIPFVIDRNATNDGFDILFGTPSSEIIIEGSSPPSPYIFRMGQGLGLKNNDRTPNNNLIVTRLAGYGSTDNIPFGYPKIIWSGDQSWNYTILNDSAQANSYPIIDGVIDGEKVRLIHHPFTRSTLMPTAYVDSVNRRVNPMDRNYDPDTEIIDYYEATNGTYWDSSDGVASIYTLREIPLVNSKVYTADGTEYGFIYAVLFSGNGVAYILVNSGQKFYPVGTFSYSNVINKEIPTYAKVGFDGSDNKTNIKPTIVDTKYNGQSIDIIKSISWINDDGTPASGIDDIYDSTTTKYAQGYFKIEFYPLGFDLYAMAAVTSQMTVAVNSGACNGCKFEVQVDWELMKSCFYDFDGTFNPSKNERWDSGKFPDSTDASISVIVKKDTGTFGTLMPNKYQQPQAGDKFVFLGIEMPSTYIVNAQKKLDGAMLQYMKDNNVAYYDYPLDFDAYFLSTNQYILSQIKTNCIVRFEYAGEVLALSVKDYSISWGDSALPTYKITLTDDVSITLNSITQLSNDLSQIGSKVNTLQSHFDKDVLIDLAKKLSKVDDDRASGLITFLKGIAFTLGYSIDELGNAFLNVIQANGINVKDLTVTGVAKFFKLVIDEIKSTSGGYISSPADGFEIDRVDMLDGTKVITTSNPQFYRLYWRATDGNKTRNNMWEVGDQALHIDFNNAASGSDINNSIYWACVVEKSSAPIEVDISGVAYQCHYITISHENVGGVASINTQGWDSYNITVNAPMWTGNGVPNTGDSVTMLGHRFTSKVDALDVSRQSAIYETSYSSLDTGIKAPLKAFYNRIDDFNLASHRGTFSSVGEGRFVGDLSVTSGGDLDAYLTNKLAGVQDKVDSLQVGAKNMLREYDTRFDFLYWGGSGTSGDVPDSTINGITEIQVIGGIDFIVTDENGVGFKMT